MRSTRIFVTLAFANLAYAVTQTLLVPALPDIQRSLHTTPVGVTSLITVFFLSGAVSAGLFGRLGDMIGKRRVVTAQLALFTAGALVCAVSRDLVVLIVGRAIMGLAATLFPLSASIVRDELKGRWINDGIAFLGASIGIGAAIGLACGGIIVDHIGYAWIFWTPVFLGAVATITVAAFVPESSVRSPGTLDTRGALLLALGLGAPLLAVSRSPDWGWGAGKTLALLAAGVFVLVAFVAHERRHPAPLLDIALLLRPQVALTNAATFLVGFGMFGTSVILVQFLQEPARTGYGLGATATQAAIFLVPGTTLMLFTAPVSGWVTSRAGPKITLLSGTAVAGTALCWLSQFHEERVELYLVPTAMYVGIGFALAAMPLLILNAVPSTERGQATAANQIFRLVGSSVGTSIAATIITGSVGAFGLPTESSYGSAFLLEALGAVGAFLIALTIPGRGRPLETEATAAAVAAVASGSELS
jgi:MFS family permease